LDEDAHDLHVFNDDLHVFNDDLHVFNERVCSSPSCLAGTIEGGIPGMRVREAAI
jgi:hypothetical protein